MQKEQKEIKLFVVLLNANIILCNLTATAYEITISGTLFQNFIIQVLYLNHVSNLSSILIKPTNLTSLKNIIKTIKPDVEGALKLMVFG